MSIKRSDITERTFAVLQSRFSQDVFWGPPGSFTGETKETDKLICDGLRPAQPKSCPSLTLWRWIQQLSQSNLVNLRNGTKIELALVLWECIRNNGVYFGANGECKGKGFNSIPKIITFIRQFVHQEGLQRDRRKCDACGSSKAIQPNNCLCCGKILCKQCIVSSTVDKCKSHGCPGWCCESCSAATQESVDMCYILPIRRCECTGYQVTECSMCCSTSNVWESIQTVDTMFPQTGKVADTVELLGSSCKECRNRPFYPAKMLLKFGAAVREVKQLDEDFGDDLCEPTYPKIPAREAMQKLLASYENQKFCPNPDCQGIAEFECGECGTKFCDKCSSCAVGCGTRICPPCSAGCPLGHQVCNGCFDIILSVCKQCFSPMCCICVSVGAVSECKNCGYPCDSRDVQRATLRLKAIRIKGHKHKVDQNSEQNTSNLSTEQQAMHAELLADILREEAEEAEDAKTKRNRKKKLKKKKAKQKKSNNGTGLNATENEINDSQQTSVQDSKTIVTTSTNNEQSESHDGFNDSRQTTNRIENPATNDEVVKDIEDEENESSESSDDDVTLLYTNASPNDQLFSGDVNSAEGKLVTAIGISSAIQEDELMDTPIHVHRETARILREAISESHGTVGLAVMRRRAKGCLKRHEKAMESIRVESENISRQTSKNVENDGDWQTIESVRPTQANPPSPEVLPVTPTVSDELVLDVKGGYLGRKNPSLPRGACYFFHSKTGCRNGSNCKFSHAQLDEAKPIAATLGTIHHKNEMEPNVAPPSSTTLRQKEKKLPAGVQPTNRGAPTNARNVWEKQGKVDGIRVDTQPVRVASFNSVAQVDHSSPVGGQSVPSRTGEVVSPVGGQSLPPRTGAAKQPTAIGLPSAPSVENSGEYPAKFAAAKVSSKTISTHATQNSGTNVTKSGGTKHHPNNNNSSVKHPNNNSSVKHPNTNSSVKHPNNNNNNSGTSGSNNNRNTVGMNTSNGRTTPKSGQISYAPGLSNPSNAAFLSADVASKLRELSDRMNGIGTNFATSNNPLASNVNETPSARFGAGNSNPLSAASGNGTFSNMWGSSNFDPTSSWQPKQENSSENSPWGSQQEALPDWMKLQQQQYDSYQNPSQPQPTTTHVSQQQVSPFGSQQQGYHSSNGGGLLHGVPQQGFRNQTQSNTGVTQQNQFGATGQFPGNSIMKGLDMQHSTPNQFREQPRVTEAQSAQLHPQSSVNSQARQIQTLKQQERLLNFSDVERDHYMRLLNVLSPGIASDMVTILNSANCLAQSDAISKAFARAIGGNAMKRESFLCDVVTKASYVKVDMQLDKAKVNHTTRRRIVMEVERLRNTHV